MSESIERLLVRIDATAEQLRRELKIADQAVGKADQSISQRLSRMRKRFSTAAAGAAKLGQAAAAAGAAIAGTLVSAGLQSVDSLAKVSDRLGIATQDLASLRFAAEQTGVSTGTLDMGLQRMTRRVAEAAQGTGAAQGALEELGLSARALAEQSPDQMFRQITEAMEGVDNQSDRVRLAMKLFDSEGVSLVQTMKGGTKALDEFARQAQTAGLTINRFDAAKVEAANDAFNRVRKMVHGLGQQLAVKLAPVLEGIADRFFGVGVESGGMASLATTAFKAIVKAAGVVGNSIRLLQLGWTAMKWAFQKAAHWIVLGLEKLLQKGTWLWNKLPWTDKVEVKAMFSDFLATMESEIAASEKKIKDLLEKPLPTDTVEDWAETHTRKFEAAAITVGKVSAAVDDLEDDTKELGKTTKEVVPKVASEWDKALQGTFERIDTAFADAWKGAFRSFKDFANGIKNALKNLLAELAHLAITKPILLKIGAALGIGSASSAAAASGGLGSLFSGGVSAVKGLFSGGLSGALGALGSPIIKGLTGLEAFAASQGWGGVANWLYGAQNGLATTGAVVGGGAAAGGALTGGAGIIGGLLANSLFGRGTGTSLGSTLGGIGGGLAAGASAGAGGMMAALGAVAGPIGALVGALLGGALGSVFNKKPDKKTAFAQVDLQNNGDVSVGGWTGKQFSQENRDAVGKLGELGKAFAAAIGGSNTLLDLAKDNRRGFWFNEQNYGSDVNRLIRDMFAQILAGAKHLDDGVKGLIQSFRGTPEAMNAFAAAMVNISKAVGGNVVRRLRDSWADMRAQSVTAVEAYHKQIDAISDLVSNFDGSSASAARLNAALTQNQQAAAALTLQILNLSAQIGEMFGKSAQQIRESVMTEAQLFEVRKNQRDALRRSIDTMTDPAQIEKAAQEINRLNTLLFQSIKDPGSALAEQYASYAEATNQHVQDRLNSLLDGLEKTQQAQNDQIRGMMESAAEAQQRAANTFAQAAGMIAGAASVFSSAAVAAAAASSAAPPEVNA